MTAVIEPAISSDQVDMTITLNDGWIWYRLIDHATLTGLAEGILLAGQTRSLVELCWEGDAGRLAGPTPWDQRWFGASCGNRSRSDRSSAPLSWSARW